MEQNIFIKKINLITFFMIASGFLLFYEFVLSFWLFEIMSSQINYNQYSIIWFVFVNLNVLLISILFIVFAYFIRKRKKWAWFAAIVLLLREVVAGIYAIPLLFTGFSDLISYFKELQVATSAPILTFSIIMLIISILIYVLVLISLIFLIKYRRIFLEKPKQPITQ